MNKEERKLDLEFKRLGAERRRLGYKLQALLPEINRLCIYKKAKCSSIYKYASINAGLSRTAVDEALRVDKHLERLPRLRAMVEKQGINKVALVSKIVTPETEEFWVDKVESTTQRALKSMGQEERAFQKKEGRSLYGTAEAEKYKCNAAVEKLRIDFDEEMQQMFYQVKKAMGDELSNKDVMRILLKKYIQGEKNQKSQNLIDQKMCVYPGCNKPAEEVHHPKRVSEGKNKENLRSLCRVHHEYMHNGLVKNEMAAPEEWRYSSGVKPQRKADVFFRRYRLSGMPAGP